MTTVNQKSKQSIKGKVSDDQFDLEIKSEKFKETVPRLEYGMSLIGLVIGGAMLGVGVHYRDVCPNGAAQWLLISGAIALTAQLLNFWAKVYQKFALENGKITSGEKFVMAVNRFLTALVSLVEFAILIYGSVVVFGAWAKWTHDDKDKNLKEYCEYTPMMFAS